MCLESTENTWFVGVGKIRHDHGWYHHSHQYISQRTVYCPALLRPPATITPSKPTYALRFVKTHLLLTAPTHFNMATAATMSEEFESEDAFTRDVRAAALALAQLSVWREERRLLVEERTALNRSTAALASGEAAPVYMAVGSSSSSSSSDGGGALVRVGGDAARGAIRDASSALAARLDRLEDQIADAEGRLAALSPTVVHLAEGAKRDLRC